MLLLLRTYSSTAIFPVFLPILPSISVAAVVHEVWESSASVQNSMTPVAGEPIFHLDMSKVIQILFDKGTTGKLQSFD